MEQKPIIFEDLDPPKRLLMGPGPVDVYPSVLDALSKPMLGQFDPQFTEYEPGHGSLPAGIPDGKSMDVSDRRYF